MPTGGPCGRQPQSVWCRATTAVDWPTDKWLAGAVLRGGRGVRHLCGGVCPLECGQRPPQISRRFGRLLVDCVGEGGPVAPLLCSGVARRTECVLVPRRTRCAVGPVWRCAVFIRRVSTRPWVCPSGVRHIVCHSFVRPHTCTAHCTGGL
jgi:hypothetical protein